MRHAAIGAAAVMTGTTWTPEARAQQAATEAAAQQAAKAAAGGDAGLKMSSALSPDLDVVKKSKGPVMTVVDEFYKVGPGPSSSHTIGPMRITYDFYQRCTKLPADQLAQATGLKVHLFGSLSATGKGHGTERAVARRPRRQGTGHRGPAVPRRDDRQAAADLSGEARRARRSTCRWPTSSTTRRRAISRTRTP